MSKILLIFKREYITRVKKRSFIITTLLVPLGFILLFAVQILLISSSTDSIRIAVVDETNQITIADSKDGNLKFIQQKENINELKDSYQSQNFDGVLHIPKLNYDNPNGIQYFSDELLGMRAKEHIESRIERQIRSIKLNDMGVDEDELRRVDKVKVDVFEARTDQEGIATTGIATGVGFLMGFLMYMVIFIYGTMVMRGVMEEKTNRIVEVILSSVRPFQLMLGKIMGIGAVGLTQFLIWFAFISGINLITAPIMARFAGDTVSVNAGVSEQEMSEATDMFSMFQAEISELPLTQLFISFAFFFLLGFLLYAALFAAVGSAINDDSDTQTLTLPVSIPVIIAIFILSAIMETPNSGLAFWSSMIPFFSPIIMPFRIAFGVPMWEILLSLTLLAIGAVAMVWLAGKIYRTAILIQGKKITFYEIGKWMLKS